MYSPAALTAVRELDAEWAETHYGRVLTRAEELGMWPIQAHCTSGSGEHYPKAGRLEEARVNLLSAIELYRTMGMTFWPPEAEAAPAQTG